MIDARGSSAASDTGPARHHRLATGSSGAAPAPREGLPPCIIYYAQYENRVAVVHDQAYCQWPDEWHRPDLVVAFATTNFERSHPDRHPCCWIVRPSGSLRILPASEWPRAERWVRTGVLDEA